MSFDLGGVARLYNKLFTLPSSLTLLFVTIIAHFLIGVLIWLSHFSSPYLLSELASGGFWGLSVLLSPSLASLFVSAPIVREESGIWTLRRLLGLNLFALFFWSVPAIVGGFLRLLAPQALTGGVIVGVEVMLLLRIIVFKGVADLSVPRSVVAASTQPLLLVAALIFSGFLPASTTLFAEMAAVSVLPVSSGLVYLYVVDVAVKKRLGVGGLRLLYGFLAEWLSDYPHVLERTLSKIGCEEERPVLILKFASGSHLHFVLVVPTVHPGPFKTVGGSMMPHMVMDAVERRFHCVTGVAHGPSTHAQNPVSQSEVVKLIESVLSSLSSNEYVSGFPVSPLVYEEIGKVKVGCQIFGSLALFIVTLAPHSFDDLDPKLMDELSFSLTKDWKGNIFLIDAHNCNESGFDLEPIEPGTQVADEIIMAARGALKKAKKLTSCHVRVGGGRTQVRNAGVREGIGRGGVTAFLIDVEGFLSAYVIIDGNNMVPGLREKIIERVCSTGVQTAEVLTSDTHETNAVSLRLGGANPVGSSIDWNLVVDAALEAVSQAERSMVNVEPSFVVKKVHLKVIGEEQIRALSAVIQQAAKEAKRAIVVPALSLLLSIIPLFLLL